MSDPDLPGPQPDLHDTLEALSTERADPDLADLETRPTRELVRLMLDGDRVVLDAVAACTDQIATAVDAIAARLARGGSLVHVGAGTPGRLGVLDASEIPPTFGADPTVIRGVIAGGTEAVFRSIEAAEDDPEAGAQAVADVTAADAVVGISASGRTPFVLGALRAARRAGAFTVAVANNAGSQTGAEADVAIEAVTGPEFIAGSTRLRAGTAQKLVLNALSTLTMMRLGKTYGNLMVDVQASNDKLRARAERLVCQATGVGLDEAGRALAASDWSVKTAILVLRTGLDPAAARLRLLENDGHLRAALA